MLGVKEIDRRVRKETSMRSPLPQIAARAFGNYARGLTCDAAPVGSHKGSYKSRARRLERVLDIGNWLYRAVRRIENNWRNEVLDGLTPYSPDDEQSIRAMWTQWLAPTQKCLDEIRTLRESGVKVRGARLFEGYVQAASQILVGNDAFFEDTEKAWRWSALTANFRSSPRPVRVDEQGRMFEITGERFVPPGLTAADVANACSPTDESRARPLRDIIAARAKNGL